MNLPTPVADYYNRHDPAKNYDAHLMREGRVTQAAEINEIQSEAANRLKDVADALFRDGDIIQDAQVIVNPTTGAVQATAGKIYLCGAVRSVPAASFSVPVSGTVSIGVRIQKSVVTELEDPALRNPAIGSRGEGEPGAWRLKVVPVWGFDADGSTGDFYPVYVVDDGELRAKETPPNLDAVNQAISRYDHDSTGTGTYAVSGMRVLAGEDLPDGRQVYHVSEGRARVDGCGVELPTSRRLIFAAKADLRLIDTEVHAATAESASAGQRITLAHPPLKDVTALRITAQSTATLTHGAYAGAVDALPDTSIVSIVQCKQGDTIYTPTTDYKKTGDAVDWSPSGNEPAAGSTYTVTYTHIKAVLPEKSDADGFTVTGAVEGTSILASYNQMLPRFDRLALTAEGTFTWFTGVASESSPQQPTVPETMLTLASVRQTWRPGREVSNDAVRVVPFDEIVAINRRIDYALQEIARQRLESDVATRESGARVGLFVDPLLDDSMRDQGVAQTAAVVDGILTLPVTEVVALSLPGDVAEPAARPYTAEILLAQPLRTTSMKVNPYMAFDPLPAKVSLTPAVDRWTDVQTRWTSAITRTLTTGSGVVNRTLGSSTSTELVSSSTQQLEHLRQIDVSFRLEGFGSGEILTSILFDGVALTPQAL